MGNSVAGQIRIDLIAQAAQFNAGLREGKQGLGSFREEFERFSKSFDSQKNFESRMNTHAAAWKASVGDMRRFDGEGFRQGSLYHAPHECAGQYDERSRRSSAAQRNPLEVDDPLGQFLRVSLTP